MDGKAKDILLGMENSLKLIHQFIEELAKKQRLDITTALTGNTMDKFEYVQCTVALTEEEFDRITDKEKNQLCARMVDRALGKNMAPKSKKRIGKKIKVPRNQSEVAKLLFQDSFCSLCCGSEGFQCEHIK